VPLSLREGSTENATVATALLSDLTDRGLRLHEGQLFVLDGAKALRKAVRDVAGTRAPVHRCHRHYADSRVMPTRARTSCSGRRGGRSCRHNHSPSRNARTRSVGW
jgi:transposase-like protein